MKVVQYSHTPVAGSPWFTHKALKDWTDVDSTLVQLRSAYGDGRVYPYDRLYDSDSPDLFKRADIVHLQNYAPNDEAVRRILVHKPVLAQHHQWPPFIGAETVVAKRLLHAVIAQPVWVKQYIDNQQVTPLQLPNIIPIRDPLFLPDWMVKPEPHEKLHVAYAPSLRTSKGLHTKGYKDTYAALEKLKAKGHLTYEIMEGLPLVEVLRRKKRAHVVIDECVTGNFHRASLESLSQGACVVAWLPFESRRYIREYVGANEDELPWAWSDIDNLEATLGLLSCQPELVVEKR
ncbi:MAG: hypothetical protein ACYS7M_12975, partial [Planctomycetota bacterium]